MKKWIEAARPKTLIASLSPVLIGSAIAWTQRPFSFNVFWVSAIFALAIQIGTNFANDYLDFLRGADTNKRKGPKRLVQSGEISVGMMKKVTFAIFVIAALSGLYLMIVGGWQIGLLAAMAILFGYLYTGGPYPLGYLGLGDLFVFVFFGPVAASGVIYLHTGEVPLVGILAGLGPGLLSTTILAMNNLRDREEDVLAHKKTLPVRFGKRFGQWEIALTIGGAFLLPLLLFFLMPYRPFLLAACLPYWLGLSLIKKVFSNPSPKALAPLFPLGGKLLTLYTLCFIIGWLL
ncbi:MAG: 1,4-dihydroxy-2-naphthoate polyprenyltransferase [Chlamydiia bacterium]|nr:1,4-dihydroxy-2-naphthoate polyprenyltransferase [Chlamydiia bacterium]